MLLNPNHLQRQYPDRRSAEIMAATVDFFESRGKARLKSDDHERVWYSDFLDHIGRERIFASLLTPSAHGASDDLPVAGTPTGSARSPRSSASTG